MTTSKKITKVLIANRGEIAVRIARAAKDAGIQSVAVYADQDRDAMHVKLADEAYALHGTTGPETYLVIEKILGVAKKSGADAVHPGYGFLAENAEFASKVIEAGLIWIGPSPKAIEQLGDKVSARHVAERAGAPLAPGTLDPVSGAAEVLDFVAQHGLPVAIKAAFGGGGRGIKVAYKTEEVAELFESATREAIAAFGRGECFVEKYLEKPRHVETQCLADAYGNVVVVSTRDCSLQRRHQKLVEEAPAPFLTDAQRKEIHESAKRICKEAGYYGAGGPLPFARRNVVKLIGYDWSEGHRGDITTDDFYDYLYPLKAWHHERRHNVETIARHGLPQPGKSACFFCPSSKKPELVQLAVRHPELRDRAVAMEANAAGNLKTVKGLGRRFSWTEFFATLEGPANPGKDSPCMCVGAVDEGSVIDSDDE